MDKNYRQDPLPFSGDGVYNQNEAAPTGHSDPEDLHYVWEIDLGWEIILESVLEFVGWLAEKYPRLIDEYLDEESVSRETGSGG